MSGGGNSSKSESKPLTGPERANIFNYGLGSISQAMGGEGYKPGTAARQVWVPGQQEYGGEYGTQYGRYETIPGSPESIPQLAFPEYDTPGFTEAGSPRTLSGSDYDRLETGLRTSAWAPIEAQMDRRFTDIDQEMADRGLYTSGVGADTKQDIYARDFLPAYTQISAGATGQRYGLQAAEQARLDELDMNEAARMTQFDAGVSDQEFAAKWAPLEYLMGIYNQTGGTVNTGKSSGWNFGI